MPSTQCSRSCNNRSWVNDGIGDLYAQKRPVCHRHRHGICTSSVSHADLDFLRPLQVEQDEKALIAAEYSYFDLSFDFLNYLENINTGAKPEESSAARISIHMPVFQRFSFDYQHTSTNAVVSRSAQPFELDSDGTEHRLNANY